MRNGAGRKLCPPPVDCCRDPMLRRQMAHRNNLSTCTEFASFALSSATRCARVTDATARAAAEFDTASLDDRSDASRSGRMRAMGRDDGSAASAVGVDVVRIPARISMVRATSAFFGGGRGDPPSGLGALVGATLTARVRKSLLPEGSAAAAFTAEGCAEASGASISTPTVCSRIEEMRASGERAFTR